MRLLIDADACPVREEAMNVAARHGIATLIVSAGGIRPSRDPAVTIITVPAGADAADDRIVEEAAAGDIVVTQDIPLAARVLGKGASALSPYGRVFDATSIGMALAVRDLNQQVREATQSQTRHRAFSPRDRSTFLQNLDKLVVASKRAYPSSS